MEGLLFTKGIFCAPHFKMQVAPSRAMGIAGIADVSDQVALRNIIADRNFIFLGMGVTSNNAIGMLNINIMSITVVIAI